MRSGFSDRSPFNIKLHEVTLISNRGKGGDRGGRDMLQVAVEDGESRRMLINEESEIF